jgi:hypothetical protein
MGNTELVQVLIDKGATLDLTGQGKIAVFNELNASGGIIPLS